MNRSLSNNSNSFDIKKILSVYLAKWPWILAGIIIALCFAFYNLRYATYQYQIQAAIKLKTEDDSEGLQRLQAIQEGLYTQNHTDVLDEIETLKSRKLIGKVVDKLNLNTQFFAVGKIGNSRMYKNPPLGISFFETDSIIKNVDTSFTIEIKSPNEFSFIDEDETNDNLVYEFGSKINTSFGGFVLTPNTQKKQLRKDSRFLIKIVPEEKIVAALKGKLTISPSHLNSSILKLGLRDAVKAKGEDILNTLIKEYNQSVVEDKLNNTKSTSDFINDRLNAISVELSEFDMTAENVRKNNRLTDLEVQSSLYLESERQNEAMLAETNTQIELIDYLTDYLDTNKDLGKTVPTNLGIQDNNLNELNSRINDLVIQRNKILENSTVKNPTIVNLDRQISELRGSIKQNLMSMRSSNEIRRNALREEDRKLSGRIYSAPKKERQSRDITRQQNIKESLYLYLLEKREESAIAQGISTPNAKIIDDAFSSINPVTPKRNITFMIAFILGALIPIGIIYLLELLNSKVNQKSNITDVLDAPFLGDIPHSKKKHALVKQVDYSPKAEAFRMIRTNIDFMLADAPTDKAKIIFVTSTTSKEGKSHTAINLASSLSFSNKKVLIIETDIRMPKANAYLNMKKKELGLTDYIGNSKLKIGDVLTSHEDNPNLHLISSGTVPPNPAELLMSERMGVLFEKVSDMYDYIIVDTAAVGLVTDTLLISKYADMFVYVVRAGYLEKDQLNVAQRMYEEKRLPNMAILLNDVKSKKGYGYGYGNNPNRKVKWWKKKLSLAKS